MKMKRNKRNKFDTPENRRRAEQAVNVLLAKPQFRSAIEELRIKWGINTDNPKRKQNLKKMDDRDFVYADSSREKDPDFGIMVQPNSSYFQDMFELLKRFRLDRHHMPLVWKLAKYGDVGQVHALYADRIPFVTFKPPEKDWDTQPRIVIELRTNSTLQDVKKVWNKVEQMRKLFNLKSPKFKLWENFDRDNELYELYMSGKSFSEICLEMDKKYGTKTEDGMTETHARKIITTFRKRLGLNNDKRARE